MDDPDIPAGPGQPEGSGTGATAGGPDTTGDPGREAAEAARSALRTAGTPLPGGRTVEISGLLQEGLRGGTGTIRDDRTQRRYLIRNPSAHGLAFGETVTLRGWVPTGVMTVEQQGDPLTVTAVLSATRSDDSTP